MAGIGIGGVGNNLSFSPAYVSNKKPQEQLASGKKINSAADDAAGLAIAQKLENQARGAEKASDNAKDMRNLLNIADGALGGISESLSRVRELSIQSLNGIYTQDDKKIFQTEVKGIIEDINSVGKDTEYNGKTLLDGSFVAQNAAIGANGQSMEINVGSVLTDELGVSGYDVTQSMDVGDIDKALDTVLTQMAEVGAQTNRLEYSGRVADTMAYNQEVARSRIEDADIAQASMENNRRNITEQTKLSVQKMQMQGMGQYLQLLG